MPSHPLQSLRAALAGALIEREREVDAILLGLLAREHVLLVGPPGTGKSLLCRSIAAGITGCRYVERLLSPTTPPEALWGPISLAALRDDRYEHVTAGSVADGELVFLDEFFRGGAAVLDSLLHALGPERQTLIGTRQVQIPLRTAVAAANTWADSSDQAAILDRWLLRLTVAPLTPGGRRRLLREELAEVGPQLTLEQLDAESAAAMSLPVAPGTFEAMDAALEELAAAGIRPSDRRCRGAVKIARAAAALDGADQVQPQHLEALGAVLWDQPTDGQPEKAAEIVLRIANPTAARIEDLLRQADESSQAPAADAAATMASVKKLEEIERELKALPSSNGRGVKAMAYVKRERVRLQARALGIDPEKAAALLG